MDIAGHYTERNNLENFQYELFLDLRVNFICTLHDFTCMLLFETVQDVESTAQDVGTNGNPVNLTVFPIDGILIGTLI